MVYNPVLFNLYKLLHPVQNVTIADVKKTIIIAIALILGTLLGSGNLYAQQPLEKRCKVAQQYLKNVQRTNDLRARVDRLQAYQYINQRLDLFVTRLEKNSQPMADQLRSELDNMQEITDDFKRHYEAYDEARDQVVNLEDCSNKVARFQELLLAARDKRTAVYKDVVQIQNAQSGLLQQLEALNSELKASE